MEKKNEVKDPFLIYLAEKYCQVFVAFSTHY